MAYFPLGQKILQIRSRLGLTQKELARRMGTSQQAVSRLERGMYSGYTLRTLAKLARATGTELVVEFLDRDAPPDFTDTHEPRWKS